MLLRIERSNLNIEDPRSHPAETVDRLRELLAAGVEARPDVRRRNFFEIDDGGQAFYIHISPVGGKVLLLATWIQDLSSEPALAAAQVA